MLAACRKQFIECPRRLKACILVWRNCMLIVLYCTHVGSVSSRGQRPNYFSRPHLQKDNILYTCQWHLSCHVLWRHFHGNSAEHWLSSTRFSQHTLLLNHVQPWMQREKPLYFSRLSTLWFQYHSLGGLHSTVSPNIGTLPLGRVLQEPGYPCLWNLHYGPPPFPLLIWMYLPSYYSSLHFLKG